MLCIWRGSNAVSYCCLLISSKQSGHFSLVSGSPLDIFCINAVCAGRTAHMPHFNFSRLCWPCRHGYVQVSRMKWPVSVDWVNINVCFLGGGSFSASYDAVNKTSLSCCSGSVRKYFMDLCLFRSSGSHTCRNTFCRWAIKTKCLLPLHLWQLQRWSIQ